MNTRNDCFVILTPGFPAAADDSACLPWMQNIVRNLQSAYPAIKIIVLSFQYPYIAKEYLWEGITVIPYGGANRGGLKKIFLRNKIYKKLKELNNSFSIKGILSFWYGECAAAGHAFAHKHHLRHACWIAGQDAKIDNKYPGRLRIPGDNLVAGSEFLCDHFTANHGVLPKWVIVPGTDALQFEKNPVSKDIDLLATGSLIPLKQFEQFVETVKKVKELFPGVKAVLIGKGPEKEKLEMLIEKYGLQQHLQLKGELPYQETLHYMQRARVFIHPSAYEGFGCVCTEALYAGAKVIRFTQPMKKVMRNTFQVNNTDELAGCAIQLLTSETVYECVNEFPIEETVQKLAALFRLERSDNL